MATALLFEASSSVCFMNPATALQPSEASCTTCSNVCSEGTEG